MLKNSIEREREIDRERESESGREGEGERESDAANCHKCARAWFGRVNA